METLIAWGLTTLGSAFLGSYLASYLKKKGENLATHEDLDKLVEQVRAVTRTTKEIEAKISTDVWDRQKRWEMKRDVLFEATRRLGAFWEALLYLQSACEAEREKGQPGEVQWLKLKNEAGQKWREESRKFEETVLLVGIVCSKEVKEACDGLNLLGRRIVAGIYKDDLEIYSKFRSEFADNSKAVTAAIRKELETDKTT